MFLHIVDLLLCHLNVLQVEGPKSPEEMLTMLQKVLEESAPVLVAARLDAEERLTNMRLREEQDAAYRAALEADQVRNSSNLSFCLPYALFSMGQMACSLPPVSVLAKTDFLKRTTSLFFLWCLIAILHYIRLGNARGEKSKIVL